ncbi:MAG: MFS transporter [Planctomycetota bacterium]|nr:MFS transporter [Planctomycetota bacterium]
MRSLRALDALHFALADGRDGLGPFLAVFLASRHWDQRGIGAAMSAMTIATVVAQVPAGGFIDGARRKRLIIVVASIVVAAGCVLMARRDDFSTVIVAQLGISAATAFLGPALTGITLGLVGRGAFSKRMGRNEAFNHAGNVVTTLTAGYLGDHVSTRAIFDQVALTALASAAATFLIRGREIDPALARGADLDAAHPPRIAAIGALMRDRRIVAFVAATALFHLGNAAMLPLVGIKITDGKSSGVATDMSACIIAAQLVMIPVAIVSTRLADRWGRRPVLLIGFGVLPIRGLLYTLSTDRAFLVAVQLLDGVGAAVLGVVGVLVIADLTRGTGRFNLMQGVLAAATGVGASLSNLVNGFVVHHAGFDAGFIALAGFATLAWLFLQFTLPETRPSPCVAT